MADPGISLHSAFTGIWWKVKERNRRGFGFSIEGAGLIMGVEEVPDP